MNILFVLFTKQANLMKGSIVLSFPPQLVFPVYQMVLFVGGVSAENEPMNRIVLSFGSEIKEWLECCRVITPASFKYKWSGLKYDRLILEGSQYKT